MRLEDLENISPKQLKMYIRGIVRGVELQAEGDVLAHVLEAIAKMTDEDFLDGTPDPMAPELVPSQNNDNPGTSPTAEGDLSSFVHQDTTVIEVEND